MMDQPSQQTQGVKHFEAEIEKTWLRYSIFEIILAILMIAIGANYYGIVDGKEICPNNAALPYSLEVSKIPIIIIISSDTKYFCFWYE